MAIDNQNIDDLGNRGRRPAAQWLGSGILLVLLVLAAYSYYNHQPGPKTVNAPVTTTPVTPETPQQK